MRTKVCAIALLRDFNRPDFLLLLSGIIIKAINTIAENMLGRTP
ncbi:hypothetical protein [Phormidium nigroviride]